MNVLRSRNLKQAVRRSVHNLNGRLQIIVFAVFMLVGVFAGSVMASSIGGDSQNMLNNIVEGYIQSKNSADVFYNFYSGAFSNLLILLLLFFCGFCAISPVIIILAAVFKGIGTGLVIGSLFAGYGMGALNFILIKLLPDFFICNIIVLISCSLAYSMARSVALRLRGEKSGAHSSAGYCLKFLAMAVFMLIGCWLTSFAGSFFVVSLAAG